MFKELVKVMQQTIPSNEMLYKCDVDRDKIWQVYLDAFDPELRQEHTCNCCKSFLRQFGGIKYIGNGRFRSIWELEDVPDIYKAPVAALFEYVNTLPVTNVFTSHEAELGTQKNYDENEGMWWYHFFLVVTTQRYDIATLRDNKNVMQRSFDELKPEVIDDVLQLIEDNALYRGAEFQQTLIKFRKLQREYQQASDGDVFCWDHCTVGMRLRNTAIGTLLVNLSDGMHLEDAVSKFEAVVAPRNYKRPKALVTPRMVEKAKATLKDAGLLSSIERRYARYTDLKVNNLIFVDKSSAMVDVFDDMSDNAVIKTPQHCKEMTIEEFLATNPTEIKVLVERRHFPNFVSLLTGPEPSLFSWNNTFSWAYTGGTTDSIKERVKAAGGNVDGVLRASLAWHNFDDLDIHCVEPNGNKIYYSNAKNRLTTGFLDVDMNAGGGHTRDAVENITWTHRNKMLKGKYQVLVNNYQQREDIDQGFEIQLEANGKVFNYGFQHNPKNRDTELIATFEWDGQDIIMDKEPEAVSQTKWGVATQTWTKVKAILLSPNHWENPRGNKHYIFILENCISDELPRPFFNEYLSNDLVKDHKKVLELLGSKLKVQPDDNQLSGLGFSSTIENSIVVNNNLKVRF